MTQKKKVITFNYISETLSQEEIDKLKKWYYYYHKLSTCYRWKFKSLKRKKLLMDSGSIILVAIGGVAGGVTANPIILGTISGAGILLQTYMKTKSYSKHIEMCRFAYTSYKQILSDLRNYLRGTPYDDENFLCGTKVLDDIVIDLCPSVDTLDEKYTNTFDLSDRRYSVCQNTVR